MQGASSSIPIEGHRITISDSSEDGSDEEEHDEGEHASAGRSSAAKSGSSDEVSAVSSKDTTDCSEISQDFDQATDHSEKEPVSSDDGSDYSQDSQPDDPSSDSPRPEYSVDDSKCIPRSR